MFHILGSSNVKSKKGQQNRKEMKSTRIHHIEIFDPKDNDKDGRSLHKEFKQNEELTNIRNEMSKTDVPSSIEIKDLMIRMANIEQILAKLVKKETLVAKNTDNVIAECRR